MPVTTTLSLCLWSYRDRFKTVGERLGKALGHRQGTTNSQPPTLPAPGRTPRVPTPGSYLLTPILRWELGVVCQGGD